MHLMFFCPGMNYSTTGFQLLLTRKMSFYIVTYYLPSGLFVVVSWIRSDSFSNDSQKKSLIYLPSFLVNPEIIPGRMTLLVTIFLVLINIHNTIQTNSPKVKNVCWEDLCIWFSISSLCDVLFGAIVQSMAMKLRPNKILHRSIALLFWSWNILASKSCVCKGTLNHIHLNNSGLGSIWMSF